MAFSERFLEELRAALPVSQVVGRKHKLKKEGTEFRSLDNKSLTINDSKRMWFDHGGGGGKDNGGDIFHWLVKHEGFEFRDAVVECAKIAGIALPDEERRRSSNGHADEPPPPSSPEDYGLSAPPPAARRGDNITAIYDYTDAQGQLQYQVCRLQWQEDGKPKKTFMQRRPGPDGSWLWGLGAGEFIKSRNGDWYIATKERKERWKGAECRIFEDEVKHGLYRLVEFKEEASAEEPVYIAEGEKDVDTLRGWEMVATTNSGGAKNFRPEFAEWFRGKHVVIPVDNDDAGRARGEIIARVLTGIAASIRILDFAKVWEGAPKGADVTDWKAAGGTPSRFLELVGQLSPWQPGAAARFKLIAFAAVELARRTRYLVRGIIPRSGLIIVWGPPKCGKSFWVFDLLMHVALGWLYRGLYTERGPVVYLTLEGHEDFNDRIEAFKQQRLGTFRGVVEFFLLATRIDLVAEHKQLIDDIKAQMGGRNPAAICIDTLNRSLRGSESSDEDMAAYVNAASALIEAFGCAVIVVHHCGIEAARPRGHTSLTGAADAQIKVTKSGGKDGNVVAEVEYMKGGAAGEAVISRLQSVEVGRDEHNFPITSCTIEPVDGAGSQDRRAVKVNASQRKFLDALIEAQGTHGVAPFGSLANLPRSISKIVNYDHVKRAYIDKEPDDGDDPNKYKDRMTKALQRARNELQGLKVIACEKPYIWITGRPVVGLLNQTDTALQSAQTEMHRQEDLPPDIDDFR
jgi:hypothetical protein